VIVEIACNKNVCAAAGGGFMPMSEGSVDGQQKAMMWQSQYMDSGIHSGNTTQVQ
jgi:hypothetical protein